MLVAIPLTGARHSFIVGGARVHRAREGSIGMGSPDVLIKVGWELGMDSGRGGISGTFNAELISPLLPLTRFKSVLMD